MEKIFTKQEGLEEASLLVARDQGADIDRELESKYPTVKRLRRFIIATTMAGLSPLLAVGCDRAPEVSNNKASETLDNQQQVTSSEILDKIIVRIAPGMAEFLANGGLVIKLAGDDYRLLNKEQQIILELRAKELYTNEADFGDPKFDRVKAKISDEEVKRLIGELGSPVAVENLPPKLAEVERARINLKAQIEASSSSEDSVPGPESKTNPEISDF